MAYMKFNYESGLWFRGQVKSALRNFAFYNDIDLTIEEDKGFIISNFRVHAKGTDEKILKFKEYWEWLVEANSPETEEPPHLGQS